MLATSDSVKTAINAMQSNAPAFLGKFWFVVTRIN
jgi:hypothetical protein